MLTFGSLFAGIGGLDLGLERAGMKCLWQVEIDEFCQRVLAKHWPDVERFGDVRECGKHNLKPVNLICGGDPCQRDSNSRRQGIASIALGNEFIRVIEECRPRLVLRENPTVVRRDAVWPWWQFRKELVRLGYGVLSFRLRACCFGCDHRRDRLFLLAEHAHSMCPGLEGPGQPGLNTISISGPIRQIGLSESDVVRKRNGVSHYVDRIRALGNAVVPQVAEFVGRMIVEAGLKEKQSAPDG